jgi:molybdopterin-guanine dinucleotide biosynthesis protein B
MAMFSDVSDQMKVEDVRDRFLDMSYDLIIAEGWKSENYPKIVIVREQLGEVPVSQEGLLAVVSDQVINLQVPVFDINDVVGVAAFLMMKFPKRHPRATHELEA